MRIFHHGEDYRLEDRKPQKPKKRREIRTYRPPRALSGLSCALLLLLSAALALYGGSMLFLRLFGAEAEAAPKAAPAASLSSTLYVTFYDALGAPREAAVSLLGSTERVGERVRIRYLPSRPEKAVLASRAEDPAVVAGCLFLSVFLLRAAVLRLRELRDAPAAPRRSAGRIG